MEALMEALMPKDVRQIKTMVSGIKTMDNSQG